MNREPSTRSRIGSGISWALKTIIRLLLAAFLLIALAAVVQFALAQVEQRLDNVNKRIDLLFSDVGGLMEADSEQRADISNLREGMASQSQQADKLAADLTRQEEMLVALEEKTALTLAAGATVSQSINVLGGGLVALQGDLVAEGSRIDELGGQIDELKSTSTAVAGQLDELATLAAMPDEEVERLQESLRLFRLWELIARARLHLAEDNLGLAAQDIELALIALDQPTPGDEPTAEISPGQGLGARLSLALDSLPDDPASAVRDLEAAWAGIDLLLAEALGIETIVLEIEPESPAIEATPSPTPEATPVEVTPTPTPTSG